MYKLYNTVYLRFLKKRFKGSKICRNRNVLKKVKAEKYSEMTRGQELSKYSEQD